MRAHTSLLAAIHQDIGDRSMLDAFAIPGLEIYNKTTEMNGFTIQQLLFENMGVCQTIHG
eukprot:407740-Pelagomonas_calceolata.AAC.1